ncbi:MAG: NFACT family protein [Synergistaceae bacterium]|nr:NFACT family protein [Synergistaceae bacterium]
MSFSPEFIRSLSRELDKNFKQHNPRVSKIEGGESWIALCIGADWLLFSWGSHKNGLCRATEREVAILKKSAPARTPLVEFLRSQILRGQLTGASQIQNDRIIKIDADRLIGAGFLKTRHIVFEATEPNGNFLLLDESFSIMELARHASPDENRYRTLLPGHIYVPPPPFDGLDLAELAALEYEQTRNIKGIGRQLAELIQAHWNENSAEGWLSALRKVAAKPLPAPAAKPEPGQNDCVYQVSGKGYLTLFPMIFPECTELGKNALAASRFLIEGLVGNARGRLLSHGIKIIDKAIRSRQRHKEGIEKQISRNDEAEDHKLRGQLLLEHISEIPPRAEKISLSAWDAEGKIEIELDPELSAAQNAERYFKKYRKAQANAKKMDELRGAISSIEQSIEELSEQKELLPLIDDVTELEYAVRDISDWLSPGKPEKNNDGKKKMNDKTPAHLRYEMDGAIILVGLNARGNRFVTFKQAASNDLWLHAHELPGSHVIIKGNAGDDVIEFAASLAAYYSKGKNSSKVQVDCTQKKNVRSIPGSAIAHVTYTNPRALFVSPLNKRPPKTQAVK